MTEGGGKKRKRGKKTPVAGPEMERASERWRAGPGATEPAPALAGPASAPVQDPATPTSDPGVVVAASAIVPDPSAPTLIERAPQSSPVPVRIADSGYALDSQPVAVPTLLSGSVAVSESAIMSETAAGFTAAPALAPTPMPVTTPTMPTPSEPTSHDQQLEPTAAAQPVTSPDYKAAPEVTPAATSALGPAPAVEPKAAVKPTPASTPEAKAVLEPQSPATAEPKAAGDPTPASAPTPASTPTPTAAFQPKPVVKPTTEPRPDPAAAAIAALVREDVARIEQREPSLISQLAAAHADDGSFMLDVENSDLPPAPQLPLPPILPSPAEAALEAARIVSQMVDIDTESGAVIAAAAAAGAAIEAAVAAQKVAQAEGPHDPRALNDPFSTVRLSRDRILRALHEDVESRGELGTAGPRNERARTEPGIRQPGSSGLYARARTEPGLGEGDDAGYEEFDPVAIAAAAISRLRTRARTDLAELRVHYHRLDLVVLVAAFLIIVFAGRLHNHLVTPPIQVFSERGLTFDHSASWLAAESTAPPAPRLAREIGGASTPSKEDTLYHVELTSSVDPNAKIEILIDKKPTWSNIVCGW